MKTKILPLLLSSLFVIGFSAKAQNDNGKKKLEQKSVSSQKGGHPLHAAKTTKAPMAKKSKKGK